MPRRPPQLLWIVLAVLGAGLLLLMFNHDAGSTFGLRNDDFAQILTTALLVTVFSAGVLAARRSQPGDLAASPGGPDGRLSLPL
jgi:aspartyl protease family protein